MLPSVLPASAGLVRQAPPDAPVRRIRGRYQTEVRSSGTTSPRFLFCLHKSQRDREGQAKLRIPHLPAGERLDAADAVGDGVAVHAERRGGFRKPGMVEDGAERREVLAADV